MDDDAARHISREGLAALEAERVRHRSRVTQRRDETCVWAPPLGFAAAVLDEKRAFGPKASFPSKAPGIDHRGSRFEALEGLPLVSADWVAPPGPTQPPPASRGTPSSATGRSPSAARLRRTRSVHRRVTVRSDSGRPGRGCPPRNETSAIRLGPMLQAGRIA